MTHDDLRNDNFPDEAFGKDSDALLDTADSVGDPQVGGWFAELVGSFITIRDDDESIGSGVRGTPDPEWGGSGGPVGSNAEFEVTTTTGLTNEQWDQGSIARPTAEGGDFDEEEKSAPVTLEEAFATLLDPEINWGDDTSGSDGPGSTLVDPTLDPMEHLKDPPKKTSGGV